MAPSLRPEQGLVRLVDRRGRTVGAGFIADDNGIIATCAHVVRDCGARPGDQVSIRFQCDGSTATANVEVEGWRDPTHEDTAFLRLDTALPSAAKVLPLGRATDTSGNPFHTLGYPDIDGLSVLWGQGQIVGPVDVDGISRIQLHSQHITRGYSGAPIWDDYNHYVIGMATATIQPGATAGPDNTALATPIEVLVSVRPELGANVVPPRGLSADDVGLLRRFFESTLASFQPGGVDRERRILLRRVHDFWIRGVLEESLQDREPIPLALESVANAVETPWRDIVRRRELVAANEPATKPSIPQLVQDDGQSVLILGEPGSGKTTTLLELAQHLHKRATDDVNCPAPVILNLSTWRPQHNTLDAWLAEELSGKYHIPRAHVIRWLREDALFLLLDGLDEVPPANRGGCVSSINHFRRQHGLTPIVVCSRPQEYRRLSEKLELDAAVQLLPLTAGQVEAYLANAGDDFEALRQVLRSDRALQDLSQTPLMLSILTTLYQGATTEDLQMSTPIEQRRSYLLEAYVDRMFNRLVRAGNARAPRQKTLPHLSWLAQNMSRHAQSLFQIEDLQPSWLQSRFATLAYYALSRAVPGAVVGLGTGLAATALVGSPGLLSTSLHWFDVLMYLVPQKANAVLLSLLYGAAGGAVCGLLSGMVSGLSMRSRAPTSAKRHRLHRIGIAFGVIGVSVIVSLLISATTQLAIGDTGITLLYYADEGWLQDRIALLRRLVFESPVLSLVLWLYAGVNFALLFVGTRTRLSKFDDIRSVESIQWTWRGFVKGLVVGGVGGTLLLALVSCPLLSLSVFGSAGLDLLEGRWSGSYSLPGLFSAILLTAAASLGASVVIGTPVGAAVLGIAFGLRGRKADNRSEPNQGMRRSARYAAASLAVTCLLSLLFVTAIVLLITLGVASWRIDQDSMILEILSLYGFGDPDALDEMSVAYLLARTAPGIVTGGLTLMFCVGGVTALWYGGFEVVKHLVLRVSLGLWERLPWRVADTLDAGADLTFLRRVGGGYVFIHHLLQDHLAKPSSRVDGH